MGSTATACTSSLPSLPSLNVSALLDFMKTADTIAREREVQLATSDTLHDEARRAAGDTEPSSAVSGFVSVSRSISRGLRRRFLRNRELVESWLTGTEDSALDTERLLDQECQSTASHATSDHQRQGKPIEIEEASDAEISRQTPAPAVTRLERRLSRKKSDLNRRILRDDFKGVQVSSQWLEQHRPSGDSRAQEEKVSAELEITPVRERNLLPRVHPIQRKAAAPQIPKLQVAKVSKKSPTERLSYRFRTPRMLIES